MMRKKIALIIASLLISQISYAAEVHIAFTTPVQTVTPGVMSDKITIQSQDASGGSQNIAETGDLFLTTSSATGEFSSSNTTWKAVTQLTVSKNTANRTFYYKDVAAGIYSLTATLTLRTSGVSGSARQDITVGVAVATSSSQNNTASTTQTVATTTQMIAATADLSGISAHDSPLPTSEDIKVKLQLVADAGRERIGTIHAPMTFSVSATDQAGKPVKALDTSWSFGDGTSAHGESIEHTYLYPGDYVVIMNTQKQDLAAVDRTLVHILPAAVRISRVQPGMMNDEIEIINQGKTEVNVAHWSISNGVESYAFPPDTIVLAGKQITLPYATTKISIPEKSIISLLTPDQTIASSFPLSSPTTLAIQNLPMKSTATTAPIHGSTTAMLSLADLRRKIIAVEKELAPAVTQSFMVETQAPKKTVTVATSNNPTPAVVAAVPSTTTPASGIPAKQPAGFFANIMALFK